MQEEKLPLEGLIPLDISTIMYPCPRERKWDAVPGQYATGTIVKLLVGPAKGKTGTVVVDRNSNYQDFEPYAGRDSIGVVVLGTINMNETLETLLQKGGVKSSDFTFNELRWFDSAEQLAPIKNSEGHYLQ